jgi:hypothetical protein
MTPMAFAPGAISRDALERTASATAAASLRSSRLVELMGYVSRSWAPGHTGSSVRPWGARTGSKAGAAWDVVGKWVGQSVGIDDVRKAPNHSWRHRIEDELRAGECPEDVRDAILGHARKTTGRLGRAARRSSGCTAICRWSPSVGAVDGRLPSPRRHRPRQARTSEFFTVGPFAEATLNCATDLFHREHTMSCDLRNRTRGVRHPIVIEGPISSGLCAA